jgi:transcriptional regulator with XRE-family HTH domain
MIDTREIRKKHGWTQKQFAEHIGASIRTVQAWEQGRRHPDRRYIKSIENLLSFRGITRTLLENDKKPKNRAESKRLKDVYEKHKRNGQEL